MPAMRPTIIIICAGCSEKVETTTRKKKRCNACAKTRQTEQLKARDIRISAERRARRKSMPEAAEPEEIEETVEQQQSKCAYLIGAFRKVGPVYQPQTMAEAAAMKSSMSQKELT